ncbi:hypothetical protein [Bacteriovorax sp. Seq25_V]|uniref:hypothetical protein n=1 Tax=Bacteriovorax sp. Seq25_V TaxID=1201288 RepID=UPI000389FC2C|nr:hypothetical protein [Bacteriovorax sp. Seq25_V]EQC43443.1 hypothetical protein M900_0215 [Bacteriovorax sp. Seq25_V]
MSDELTVQDLALEERKFLHDISNHIVVAQGMVNIVLKNLKEVEGLDSKVIERQEKALNALNNQVQMIKERRTVLHQRS